MASIIPFAGYRYNPKKIKNLGEVVAPPYNSIETDEQKKLYDLNKYNIVRIIKGLENDSDTETDNCYTRANQYLQEWIKTKILVKDSKPAIYMYQQTVSIRNMHFSNMGFVAMVKLSDMTAGQLMPHEDTFVAQQGDRFKLIQQTNADTSMINCMYMENQREISDYMQKLSETECNTECVAFDGSVQKLWIIDDEEQIKKIQRMLKNHSLFLVDGLNRYQSALEYAKKCKENNPDHTGKESYNYIMTLLTNAYDDGMMQLPFHRLLRFPKGFKEDFFVSAAQDHFKIEKIIVDTELGEMADTIKKQIAMNSRNMNRFAVYTGKNYFYRLTLTDEYLKKILPKSSDAYRKLDITVLNKLILEDIFNICEDDYQSRIGFTKSVTSGIEKIKSDEFQCLIAINAVKAEQIIAVATEGEKMPERSICVFPKPMGGILLNIFD